MTEANGDLANRIPRDEFDRLTDPDRQALRRLIGSLVPISAPEILAGRVANLVKVGADFCPVEQFEGILAEGGGLIPTIFAPSEIAYCNSTYDDPTEAYAARFAAKEAAIKVLGGVENYWQSIIIVNAPSEEPHIRLVGKAAEKAKSRGIDEILVTMTHEYPYAFALCAGIGEKNKQREDDIDMIDNLQW